MTKFLTTFLTSIMSESSTILARNILTRFLILVNLASKIMTRLLTRIVSRILGNICIQDTDKILVKNLVKILVKNLVKTLGKHCQQCCVIVVKNLG